jgi:hypothetical protein
VTGELEQYLAAQRQWSRQTFGEGKRTRGICEHIRKELLEIEADPEDLIEWLAKAGHQLRPSVAGTASGR